MIDVLAFGPHPDDVELFCGGTLIRLAQLQYRTAVVDLTRGERASHGTPEERAREADHASAILGLHVRENLGLPDTRLDPRAEDQLAKVVEVLRRLKPELVLAPWRQDRHPDHVAASHLIERALFLASLRPERFVPRQLFFYPLRHRIRPSLVIDTSSAATTKRAAIECYASQVRRGTTLVGSPLAIDAIEARDRFYGSMIGAAHGEALRAPNVLGVVDPIAFLRANPFTEAHAFDDEDA